MFSSYTAVRNMKKKKNLQIRSDFIITMVDCMCVSVGLLYKSINPSWSVFFICWFLSQGTFLGRVCAPNVTLARLERDVYACV